MSFNLRVCTILDGPNIWTAGASWSCNEFALSIPTCSAPRKAWPPWRRSCVSSSAITPSSASDAATENVAEKCAACSSRPPLRIARRRTLLAQHDPRETGQALESRVQLAQKRKSPGDWLVYARNGQAQSARRESSTWCVVYDGGRPGRSLRSLLGLR